MNLAPDFMQQYFDNNGNPLAGGNIYTYVAGTSTPQATYTDSTGNTPNANPVVLDSNGRASIWFNPILTYKVVIKDSSANTIKTIDNVAGEAEGGIPLWNANTTYSLGDIVADSNGILYSSRANGNLNNALTVVASWRICGGSGAPRSTVTTNTTLATSDHGTILRSDSTSGSLTHTLPACSTTPIGFKHTTKDIGSGGHSTSLKGSGSDTIDGNNTYSTALSQYEFLTVENNGTSWDTVS